MRTLGTKIVWLEMGTGIEMQSLLFYLNKLYSQLGDMAEDFKKSLDSQAQKIEDKEELARFFDWHQDEYWQYAEVFPRLFLNSFHVAAYSLLETETCKIATRIGKKQNQKFDVSEIRGGGYFESAIYYIKKLTGLDARDDSQFSCWSDLKDGQELRNIMVHFNGKVTKESHARLARKCRVYDASRKEVTLTHDYCKRFMELLKTFFSELYTEMEVGKVL